ncbi:MAG: biotin--[acetyl-CoA-carboxylase] ligase [Gammaproteobacteria bacterium]
MKKQKKVEIAHIESDQFLLQKLSHTNTIDLSNNDYQRLQYFKDCGLEFKKLDPVLGQLKYPLDLLDVDQIKSQLPEKIVRSITAIELESVVNSTNSTLLNFTKDQQHRRVCLAEYQNAGRGRQGRHWVAPFAAGICLSLGWALHKKVVQLQLISLLPTVALIRVLKSIGVKNIGAKWPNDVYCNNKKLAGILIEVAANQSDVQSLVIGIGINVYSRTDMLANIDQPWTSLDQYLDSVPTRNQVTALLITEIFLLLLSVEQNGLDGIREEWRQYDVLINKYVNVITGQGKENGISRGINNDGSISIEIDGKIKTFMSGEVSLRPV